MTRRIRTIPQRSMVESAFLKEACANRKLVETMDKDAIRAWLR